MQTIEDIRIFGIRSYAEAEMVSHLRIHEQNTNHPRSEYAEELGELLFEFAEKCHEDAMSSGLADY